MYPLHWLILQNEITAHLYPRTCTWTYEKVSSWVSCGIGLFGSVPTNTVHVLPFHDLSMLILALHDLSLLILAFRNLSMLMLAFPDLSMLKNIGISWSVHWYWSFMICECWYCHFMVWPCWYFTCMLCGWRVWIRTHYKCFVSMHCVYISGNYTCVHIMILFHHGG